MNATALLSMPRNLGIQLRRSSAASNFLWMASDRGARLLVGILVGGWSARYLGKANYGLINYVLGLIALFTAVGPLGMDGLAVREIIREPRSAGVWLGTVLAFRFAATFLCGCLTMAVVTAYLRPGEPLTAALTLVLGIGVLAQSMESGDLLFQARTQMRRMVVPRFSLFLAINVLKITLILNHFSLMWFASITALEQILGGFVTFYMVRRHLNDGGPLQFDLERGLTLLRQSWPLAIAGLFVVGYTRIGPIILGAHFSDDALGVYYAAIRIPESGNFLPALLASSLLPGLMRSGHSTSQAYRAALLRFFRINALVGYLICIPLSAGAPWIIHLLFGRTYEAAVPLMSVVAWSIPFIFMGVARGQHLMNERLTTLPTLFSALTLMVNVTANLILIKPLGLMGASLATVLAQAVSGVACSLLIPKLRWVARLQILALLTPWALSRTRE